MLVRITELEMSKSLLASIKYNRAHGSSVGVDWQNETGLDRGTYKILAPDDDLESRGRGESEADKSRRLAELKTTVFDTYAICSALLANFACSTNFIGETELDKEPIWRYAGVLSQQVLLRVCIIGGIHAMLVFMFCSLYAKSALARSDFAMEVYERFSTATGSIRMTAFWTMYSTAIVYSVQSALSSIYSLQMIAAAVFTVFLLMLIILVVRDAQRVIKAAGYIFMSEEKLKIMFEDARLI